MGMDNYVINITVINITVKLITLIPGIREGHHMPYEQDWVDEKSIRELCGLVSICTIDPGYPRSFVKHERPDWVSVEVDGNGRHLIGLENVQALSGSEVEYFGDMTSTKRLFSQVVGCGYEHPGMMWFSKEDGGEKKEFVYYPDRRIIASSKLPSEWSENYDDLNDDKKQKLSDFRLDVVIPYGDGDDSIIWNGLSGYTRARSCFDHKLDLLQGYGCECVEYHLFIDNKNVLDLRSRHVLNLMDHMLSEQDGRCRTFSRVFLSHPGGMIEYRLDSESAVYHDYRFPNGFEKVDLDANIRQVRGWDGRDVTSILSKVKGGFLHMEADRDLELPVDECIRRHVVKRDDVQCRCGEDIEDMVAEKRLKGNPYMLKYELDSTDDEETPSDNDDDMGM